MVYIMEIICTNFSGFYFFFCPDCPDLASLQIPNPVKERINNPIRRKQKKCMWRELTLSEMKAFIGSLSTMGIVKLPNIEM